MKTILEIIDDADDQIRYEMITGWTKVRAADLGLDNRSATVLWVSEEGIIVNRASDVNLQYYGGFECIDRKYRYQIGDWVMYSSGTDCVEDCLDYYNGLVKAEEEMV